MRTLILSDIHGNLDALDAVLTAAHGDHDDVWELGDVVGYGAYPNECVERVRKLGKVHLRGNHDRVSSGLETPESFNPAAAYAAIWTGLQLKPANLEWLRGLPQGPIYPNGTDVALVHGSPFDEDEYIVTLGDAYDVLREQAAKITFFGHTHLQGGFSTNGRTWTEIVPRMRRSSNAAHWKIKLNLKGTMRYLINPGSVGQPRDFDWRAAYAIFDDGDGDDAGELIFHRIPYNVEAAQRGILNAGLPQRLAERLSLGR